MIESEDLRTCQLAPPEQLSILSDIIPPQLPIHSALAQDSGVQSPLLAPLSDDDKPDLIPGYTTMDDGGSDGDDTVRAPITFYRVPNVFQSEISFPEEGDPQKVDVVFVDFIQPWILLALTYTGLSYNDSSTEAFRQETLTELMAGWIKGNWGRDC
jgi:hypothetical protein